MEIPHTYHYNNAYPHMASEETGGGPKTYLKNIIEANEISLEEKLQAFKQLFLMEDTEDLIADLTKSLRKAASKKYNLSPLMGVCARLYNENPNSKKAALMVIELVKAEESFFDFIDYKDIKTLIQDHCFGTLNPVEITATTWKAIAESGYLKDSIRSRAREKYVSLAMPESIATFKRGFELCLKSRTDMESGETPKRRARINPNQKNLRAKLLAARLVNIADPNVVREHILPLLS